MSGTTHVSTSASTPFEAAVGKSLDELTTWRYQLLAPVVLGMAMLFDSWDAIVLAQIMPALIHDWKIDPVTVGSLISASAVGQLLGSFAFGPFAERYGRMPVLFVALGLMSILSIFCALTPNYQVLMALRFLQGLTIGGALPIAATYINELAPSKTRGRFFATYQFITMSGYTISSFVGIFVIPHFGWRWMLAIGAAPLVILPIVALVLPESPRWLARRGRLDAANRALRRLGASEVKDVGPAAPIAQAEVTPVRTESKVTPLTLFSKPYRGRALTILPIWILSSIVVFGISHWAPTIYTSVYHVSHAQALQWVALAGFGYLAAVPIFGMLSDPIGRRTLSIVLCCIAALMLSALALFSPSLLPLPAILIHTGSIALSVMVMILWSYTAETFPTSVRATALGFFSSMNRLPQIFVPILIGAVLEITGSILPVFMLFAVCAVAIALVWIFFTVETSGRSLESIEAR